MSLSKKPLFNPRNKPSHGVLWQDEAPPIVFLTICTQHRQPWLATDLTHRLLVDVWRMADRWCVGRYVLMPDHLHLFTAPRSSDSTLESWITFWKSQFTKDFKSETGTVPGKWQAEHWDSRLRSWQSYAEKWEYVRNNPVRKGLVVRSEDWPYQGEVNRLDWD